MREEEYRLPANLARLEAVCRSNGWRWGITVTTGSRPERHNCTILDELIIREPTGEPGNRATIISGTIWNGDPCMLEDTAAAMLELMDREGMLP